MEQRSPIFIGTLTRMSPKRGGVATMEDATLHIAVSLRVAKDSASFLLADAPALAPALAPFAETLFASASDSTRLLQSPRRSEFFRSKASRPTLEEESESSGGIVRPAERRAASRVRKDPRAHSAAIERHRVRGNALARNSLPMKQRSWLIHAHRRTRTLCTRADNNRQPR